MENTEIRLVKNDEYNIINNVVRDTFWNVYRPGCVEHYIVDRARKNDWLVRALDYCITVSGKIVGHIMYSHANILLDDGMDRDVLVLGPICILPEYQKQGLGKLLASHTLSLAIQYGYGAVAVIGNPKFFEKLGFVPASTLNIYYQKLGRDRPAPFFLIKELQAGYLGDEPGTFEPTQVFNITMDEVDQFDTQFTPKEKIKQNNKLTIKI